MSTDELPPDPIFASSIAELKWILVAWAVSCLWVVGYSVMFGYNIDPDNLQLVWGMPAWVFWGVLLPWICSTMFTIWFARYRMIDQPLPTAPDEVVASPSATEMDCDHE
ncbi:MAG: DUF997 family protein [Pirellulaceae bacterium]